MPSNQEYKGKGVKGRSYDELSGVGTSNAGITGTTGNLNDGGRDGGVGTPDDGDSGNRQSAGHGQPGGTPALGNSQRGQANRQSAGASGQGDNSQRSYPAARVGDGAAGTRVSGNRQDAKQQGNQQSASNAGGNQQGDDRRPAPGPLDQDDLGGDGALQR